MELLELSRQLPIVEKCSAFLLPVGFVAEMSAYCGQTFDTYIVDGYARSLPFFLCVQKSFRQTTWDFQALTSIFSRRLRRIFDDDNHTLNKLYTSILDNS